MRGALGVGILNVVLVFFLVELFDATGTLMGVASRAGLLVEGKMERLNKALLADSAAIVAGSVLGTSSTTAYLESAAGVQAGGRTGLTALTVAVLFLACLFIAPLAGVVPGSTRACWNGACPSNSVADFAEQACAGNPCVVTVSSLSGPGRWTTRSSSSAT